MKRNLLILAFLIFALNGFAYEEQYSSYSVIVSDSPELLSTLSCYGVVTPDVGSSLNIDSILLSPVMSTDGSQDMSKAQVATYLSGGLQKAIVGNVADIDYDYNQNGDPIMHFNLKGTSVDGATSWIVSCGGSH